MQPINQNYLKNIYIEKIYFRALILLLLVYLVLLIFSLLSLIISFLFVIIYLTRQKYRCLVYLFLLFDVDGMKNIVEKKNKTKLKY